MRIQSTYFVDLKKVLDLVSLQGSVGCVIEKLHLGPPNMGLIVFVQPEQQLGLHYRR